MVKTAKYQIRQKVNAYTVERCLVPEAGTIHYMVRCKCGKSIKITESTLTKSQMCRTCIAQVKASKPRPEPGNIYGSFKVIRLAFDGKTNDERRYECVCNKCKVNTFVSERKLQNQWPCVFCKY